MTRLLDALIFVLDVVGVLFVVGFIFVVIMALVESRSHGDVFVRPAKPKNNCAQCLKTYQACNKKVNQSAKPDEDAIQECEDKYYDCFYQYRCHNEGNK